MRALVQRVAWAEVAVDARIVGRIEQGLLVFLGVTHADDEAVASKLALKLCKLRIFNDDAGKMNLSVQDVSGSVLVVSQFTLYGDAKRGNRPGYSDAARPEQANALYEYFCDEVRSFGLPVQTGQFGADMQVRLLNQGPVTLWLDSEVL